MKNKSHRYLYLLLITISILVSMSSCQHSTVERKRTCIDVTIFKEGKPVVIDSCFTASSSDSLDFMVTEFRKRQAEFVEKFETRLMFVVIDTLDKKPDEYEYALVLCEAGIINPDVIVTSDADYIKEKLSAYNKKNLIIKKLDKGETIHSIVEVIFKTNIRINYRRVNTTKIES